MSAQFGMVPARSYDDARMTDGLIVMLGVLSTYANRDGWVVKQKELAERRGISRQAVSKALGILASFGYVECIARSSATKGQMANEYRIIYDSVLPSDVDTAATPHSPRGERPPRSRRLPLPPPQLLEVAGGATTEVAAYKELDLEAQTKPPPPTPQVSVDRFDEFWTLYPLHKAKARARKAWEDAIRKATSEVIMDGVARYVAEQSEPDAPHTAHAATWLNNERWEDEPAPPRRGQQSSGRVQRALDNVFDHMEGP